MGGTGLALAENRRGIYRVQPSAPSEFTVSLIHSDQRVVPDEITDVSCLGARVRLAGSEPELLKGEQISVAIRASELVDEIVVPAKVVFSEQQDNQRLVGLSFAETRELLADAPEEFFRNFNRRVAQRGVKPEHRNDLNVIVRPLSSAHNQDLEFPVGVRNISANGVCLEVSSESDKFLRERAQVRLSLSLDAQQTIYDIIGSVRYRSADDGNVYYGCAFDWRETPASLDIIEEIAAYALNRFEADESRPIN